MNLTPLYVMDRMMVGIFFMCSVDFCRRQWCGVRALPAHPHTAGVWTWCSHLLRPVPASPRVLAHLPASWHRRLVWTLSLAAL